MSYYLPTPPSRFNSTIPQGQFPAAIMSSLDTSNTTTRISITSDDKCSKSNPPSGRDHIDSTDSNDSKSKTPLVSVTLCRTMSDRMPASVRNMTPEQRIHAEKALLRKIDLRILPMVIAMYIMNHLDRNNIAVARLAGLEADLHLTSVQYSVSCLKISYQR